MSYLPLSSRMDNIALGYFAFPIKSEDKKLPDWENWASFSDIVEEAKRGRRTQISSLLKYYDTVDDWLLRGAYVRLLGDAGEDSLLNELVDLFTQVPIDYRYDFAESLYYWGKLKIIPILADLCLQNHGFQDAAYIPVRLSLLLEEYPGPIAQLSLTDSVSEAAQWHKCVLDKWDQLKSNFGNDDLFIFRGKRLSISNIAKNILDDIRNKRLLPDMRGKFEAITGIDCSGFYQNGILQPLIAAKIVEDFIDSDIGTLFKDGTRYFFGHIIEG